MRRRPSGAGSGESAGDGESVVSEPGGLMELSWWWGRRSLHEAFLAHTAEPDVADSRAALGAFLVLRFADWLGRAEEPSAGAFDYQVNGIRKYLLEVESPRPEGRAEIELLLATMDKIETHGPTPLTARPLLEPLHRYASWLEDQGRLEEAADVAVTALSFRGVGPRDWAGTQLLLARILTAQARWAEVEVVTRAAERAAQGARAYDLVLEARTVRAACLQGMDDAAGAAAVLGGVIERAGARRFASVLAAAYRAMGMVLRCQGREAAALEAFVEALGTTRRLAGNEEALIGAARALVACGRPADAAAVLEPLLASPGPTRRYLAALDARLLVCAAARDEVGYRRAQQLLGGLREQLPPAYAAEWDRIAKGWPPAMPRGATPSERDAGVVVAVERLREVLGQLQ